MTTYRIASIPGDGIGVDVVAQAREVLDRAGSLHGFDFAWTDFDWSCERFLKTGAMMPADGLDQLRDHDAVFLGARSAFRVCRTMFRCGGC